MGRYLVAAGLVTGAVLAGAPVAQAGPQHHGTNPATTGCANGSTAIASRPVTDAYGAHVTDVEVRYSASCGTNWIRLYNPVPGTTAYKSIRAQGGDWLPVEADGGTVWSYSMQVYAPGSTCIEFSVMIQGPGYQADTGPYSIVIC
ncbi:DUF2690 domain-containing protein [Umezawaea sp. Da 62-37]|uniref:DUF2690 domain-containing protein n=1 Tax=Umezawaea sp. Da 62-37 TaxID=3075927 RepID=UPI0028F6D392|nr:DUF2690 domain-containing protein [Umezawaea sp. Da 62-37]WNV87201.1 DUF2690 domain-containing protein [Umezawaea sp. Da 62-37]